MARQWTCPKCKRRWPRTRQLCVCGRRRPAPRVPAHRRVLAEMPYEEWVARFGDTCNICGAPPKKLRLNRDHDHRTGEPRGLLCVRCNRALPNWLGAEWLDAAAAYLRRGVDTDSIQGV